MNQVDYSNQFDSAVVEKTGENDVLVRQFITLFRGAIAPEDLPDRNPEVDADIALSFWTALQSRAPDSALVRIDNPEPPPGGHPRTAVRILHRDMPFIIDSVLMELSHHDLVIHFLHNLTLTLTREADGTISGLPAVHGSERETLIYAEIDRVEDANLSIVRGRIEDVLSDVRAAVGDHEPIKAKVRDLMAELSRRLDEEAHRAVEFLDWLLNDHFTFLGYREFDFEHNQIRQIPGSALGTLRNRPPASTRSMDELRAPAREFLEEPVILAFSKAGRRSQVHRPAYPDYIAVKRFDAAGRVVGERGILGLYTSPVYTDQPHTIPVLRTKVRNVLARSNFDPKGFDGKALAQILATYPRNQLFQTGEDELFETAMAIAHIHERRQTRLFIRRDRYGLFFDCLVYLPRELFNTKVRLAIERLLTTTLQAQDVEFDAYFSESILVRLQLILRVNPREDIEYDLAGLERQVIELSRDWNQELYRALSELPAHQRPRELAAAYNGAFRAAYRDAFDIDTAVMDVLGLSRLSEANDIAIRFYRHNDVDGNVVQLKLFRHGENLPLSRIVPILENLGFEVIGEHPYAISTARGPQAIQDFKLSSPAPLDLPRVSDRFEDAFIHIWRGKAENDGFNRLVLSAELTWREVAILRAYARYMKQTRSVFSQAFIGDTLARHPAIAALIARMFCERFEPESDRGVSEDTGEEFAGALANVELLNEDRILRRFAELVAATLRTNYFQPDADGNPKAYLALKIATANVSSLPLPRPEFEVFVYAPDMEGVHLRSSAIARGGIRWSDRLEDYRTEVLGLMKAQVIKNAVIVPSGAKGGFVVKRDTTGWSPDEVRAEGTSCYRTFINGLLDITDNIQMDQVVPPSGVRRYDGDDPYLVVAADKGTATFSDMANELAVAHEFWLGDAFASGGSNGYDHKKMGITARGAWVSVTRHFHERGVDVQRDPITVVGIGDMSGDVFGNGMLCSSTIRLIGGFNHLHIFVDPNPNAEASYNERKRLFDLPRSSWNDFDRSIISPGGGVYSRTQKSIELSGELKDRLGVQADSLSPDELIQALLTAEVDLLWNGGIGTYVKATDETADQVGDRANDAVRVDATQLRCRVVGEGGNLGFTPNARVEFAAAGGAINTDFIDNAGGVDCSDHEVNIKILLNQALAAGTMETGGRNQVLADNQDAVANLVLANNFRQAQSLSLAEQHALPRLEEYARFIRHLEETMALDRKLDALPSEAELANRAQQNQGLYRPELATLLGYAKIQLKHDLAASSLVEDPVLARTIQNQFPAALVAAPPAKLSSHRLAEEITRTEVASEVVDHMGITFVHRLTEFVGCTELDVVRAYFAIAHIFDFKSRWDEITSSRVMADTQLGLMLDIIRLGRRACRWLIRRNRGTMDTVALIGRFLEPTRALLADPSQVMTKGQRARRHLGVQALVGEGMSDADAHRHATAHYFFPALPIVDIANACRADVPTAAGTFNAVGSLLEIDALMDQLFAMESSSHWQAMQRDALMDDLTTQQVNIAARVLKDGGATSEWRQKHQVFFDAWQRNMATVPAVNRDFALAAMTVRKLADLASLLPDPHVRRTDDS